jgi:Acetyl-coenzyme A synthetase N-terminus
MRRSTKICTTFLLLSQIGLGVSWKRIDWIKPFTKVKITCFDPGNVSIKWFDDGTTNVASNCIDRHLAKRAGQIAIIWEGDDPNESKKISYRELHDHVCRPENGSKMVGWGNCSEARQLIVDAIAGAKR